MVVAITTVDESLSEALVPWSAPTVALLTRVAVTSIDEAALSRLRSTNFTVSGSSSVTGGPLGGVPVARPTLLSEPAATADDVMVWLIEPVVDSPRANTVAAKVTGP